VRGEIHLRRLFDIKSPEDAADLTAAAGNAVATFLRAFGR
jgi:hypothetical protein